MIIKKDRLVMTISRCGKLHFFYGLTTTTSTRHEKSAVKQRNNSRHRLPLSSPIPKSFGSGYGTPPPGNFDADRVQQPAAHDCASLHFAPAQACKCERSGNRASGQWSALPPALRSF